MPVPPNISVLIKQQLAAKYANVATDNPELAQKLRDLNLEDVKLIGNSDLLTKTVLESTIKESLQRVKDEIG